MSEEIKNILIKAKELISKEENWCQGAIAKDINGNLTKVLSSDTYSFCAIGATKKVIYSDKEFVKTHISLIYKAMNKLSAPLGKKESIAKFNDNSTHNQILKLFDNAIKLC